MLKDADEISAILTGAKVGDRSRVEYVRNGEAMSADVVLGSCETVSVRLTDLPNKTPRQVSMFTLWMGK